MAYEVEALSPLVNASHNRPTPFTALFNFDMVSRIFEKGYLWRFRTSAGTNFEKSLIGAKSWFSQISTDCQDMQLAMQERGVDLLVGIGYLAAGYVIFRKLQKLYQESQAKVKDFEEKQRIDEDVTEQQRVIDDQRSVKNPLTQNKRELCILCIANRRECVFLDCGHICVCVDCLKALPFPKTCPICRCKIIQTVLLLQSE